MYGTKLFPSVQVKQFGSQLGRAGNLAKSTRVGNRSTSSPILLKDLPPKIDFYKMCFYKMMYGEITESGILRIKNN